MKILNRSAWKRVLSAVFAVVLALGCVLLPNIMHVSATTNNSKNLSTIVSEICSSSSHTASIFNSSSEKVATVELKTGTIVDDEVNAVYADGKITDSTGYLSVDTNCWQNPTTAEVRSFLKITVLKDTALHMYNPEFISSNYFTWTNLTLIKVSNGIKSGVFSTPQANPNGEGSENYTWAKCAYFDNTVSVKAGDILYLVVNGNEWGFSIPSSVLTVETVDGYVAPQGSSKALPAIVSDIMSNSTGSGTLVNGAFDAVATTEIKYGTIVDDEKKLANSGTELKNDDNSISVSTALWTGVAYLKINVKQNTTLRFYNPEFTHGGWFSWTSISVIKLSNGIRTNLHTTSEVNPNGESGVNHTWKEGKFFDCNISVQAGDTVYFCINGNEWGAQIPTNMLMIDVVEGNGSSTIKESISTGMMIYNVAQSKGAVVENNGLTSYTIKTGTLESRLDFETFADDRLTYGSDKSFITPTWMQVDQNYSIIYQVNILQDCDFRFTHGTVPQGSWAAGYTQVQIWRTTNVGTEKLSDIAISTLEVPANYYCPDTYDAKAGETYYMVYRTSNSYYGGTALAIGYEAASELELLPEIESAGVGDAIGSGTLSGSLYEISFAKGSNYTAASGSAFTSTNVTVSNGPEYIVITALENIRLDLAATGADRALLQDGTEVVKTAHLTTGDKVYVEFSQSGSYSLTLNADRTRYVAGARRNGDVTETYDLYDMINQMAFMGEGNGANMRKLSTFTITSGKLTGTHSAVLLSDVAAGKFTSGEGGANTGLVPNWYGNSKGIQLVADTGYDTIITVTATEDAYISMTFPTLTLNANWALGTYVKALVMDIDGTTVQLYNNIVTEFPDGEYFAAEAHLQDGQSLVLVYYTPTGLYGTVDIMPEYTIDTTAYDATQITDFTEARAQKTVKESVIAQLQAHLDAKDEDAYSGEKWLELQTVLQEGIDKINDAADEASINKLLEEYKAKLDAVENNEQLQAALNAYKTEKIAELDAFMESLNEGDYSNANWKKIQSFYTAGKETINKQTSKAKVDNALASVKTSMEKVEKGDSGSENTGIIVACVVAVVVIAAGVVAIILIRKKKKPAEDPKNNN